LKVILFCMVLDSLPNYLQSMFLAIYFLFCPLARFQHLASARREIAACSHWYVSLVSQPDCGEGREYTQGHIQDMYIYIYIVHIYIYIYECIRLNRLIPGAWHTYMPCICQRPWKALSRAKHSQVLYANIAPKCTRVTPPTYL